MDVYLIYCVYVLVKYRDECYSFLTFVRFIRSSPTTDLFDTMCKCVIY